MGISILVRQAKKGNKEALLQLIMEQKHDYYKLAYVYMQNREDAMDAMSDMIVILYENITKLKKEDAFYSWSKTILVNCCKSILRKRNSVVLLEVIPEEMDESCLSQKDEQMMLDKHLQQLDTGCQEVILLRYYLDLDYQNISEILNIPLGTVKSRIYRGLEKLRTSLGRDIIG